MKGNKSAGVRIIAGEWRSRRLPVADISGLRPTTDRIRETLFNWLTSYIAGSQCLDLFAGTGALGFEALSRGADEVVMIEQDRKAVLALQQSAEQLKTDKAHIQQYNALNWLDCIRDQKIAAKQFDIVFIDPPFAENLQAESLEKLIRANCLQQDALIYVEQPEKCDFELPASLKSYKEGKAGQVRFSLLKVS